MTKYSKVILMATASSVLIGCGGGSGGSGDNPTLQGRFQDSNVQGLSYNTTTQRGITGAGGEFLYEAGERVAFSVGEIELGSAPGSSILLPRDLDGNELQTTKIAQLLQSLDNDSNLDNGITILPAVAAAMTTGTQEVDDVIASLANTSTATTFDDLINNVVTPADGSGTYTAVTANDANAHLTATTQCAYSGAYSSVLSIESSQVPIPLGILLNNNGRVTAVDPDEVFEIGDFVGDIGTLSFATNPAVFTDSSSVTDTITVQSVNRLSFEDTVSIDQNTTTATLTFTRIGGSIDAKYRFTGTYADNNDADFGLFTFDIDNDNQVTGLAYSVEADEFSTITSGSITGGNALSGSFSTGATATATIDLSGGTISGAWSNSELGGSFSGTGCTLNP